MAVDYVLAREARSRRHALRKQEASRCATSHGTQYVTSANGNLRFARRQLPTQRERVPW